MARRKSKRKFRKIALSIVSILITTLILLGYGVYRFVNAPFSTASYVNYLNTSKVWREDNVVLTVGMVEDIFDKYTHIKKLMIVYLDIPHRKYSIYYVPLDVQVEYARHFGAGDLKRVYAVGNTDDNRGLLLLQDTLFKIFAVRSDGYFLISEKGWNQVTALLGQIDASDIGASLRLKNLPKVPTLYSILRQNAITNLKITDINAFLAYFRTTSNTSSYVYSLGKYHLLDSHNWDSLWDQRFQASSANYDLVKVFISNTSTPKISGLASWGARVVKNLDLNVLTIANGNQYFKENTIITTDANLSVVKALAKTFNITNIVLRDDLPSDVQFNDQVYRSKVSVLLVGF